MTDDVENKTMVAGFMLWRDRVLLVQKKRPTWQAGLWNGIGGVVEQDETPDEAMVREFREEAALDIVDWQCFCTEVEPFGASVHFFRHRVPDSLNCWDVPLTNDVGELLNLHMLRDIGRGVPVVGNLNWLIPMALDWRGTVSVVYAREDIRERSTW